MSQPGEDQINMACKYLFLPFIFAAMTGSASALITPALETRVSCRGRMLGIQKSQATAPAPWRLPPTALYAEKKRDVSRSGTKRERLNKLAELEEERVETDKSFVLGAAGGFVGLILLLLVVASATGVLDGVTNTGY